MGPLAMLDIYPPGVVARFGREAGVGEAQIAKVRQDFFDTLGKMSQQRAHAEQARIEIARALGDAKIDVAAIAKHVEEQAKAQAEAAKLWLGLLQRTRDGLSAEQRAKLDELREEKAAWTAAAALPWVCGGLGMGPPWLRGAGGGGFGRGLPRGGGGAGWADPGEPWPGFGPEGWDDDWGYEADPRDLLGPCGPQGCGSGGTGGRWYHREGGSSQGPPPWF
jgi:hypothetical protein